MSEIVKVQALTPLGDYDPVKKIKIQRKPGDQFEMDLDVAQKLASGPNPPIALVQIIEKVDVTSQQINDLKSQLEQAQIGLEVQEKDLKQAAQIIKDKDSEIIKLTETNEIQAKEIKELQDEVKGLRKQNKDLAKQVKTQEPEV